MALRSVSAPLALALCFRLASSLSLPAASGVLGTASQQDEVNFRAYMEKHGRTYEVGSKEFQQRFSLFQHATSEVDRLNSRKGKLWKAGINSLSDRLPEEIKLLNGWRGGGGRRGSHDPSLASRDFERLPQQAPAPKPKDEVDWGDLPSLFIRDQGACGSCWAVTATTVLAAHSELYGANETFSTQQVVNCVPNPNNCGGTGGCDGSTVELAMQYTMLVGLTSPEKYGKYTASDMSCKVKSEKSLLSSVASFSAAAMVHHAAKDAPGRAFGFRGWEKLPSNEYDPLIAAVNVGPVAISMAANEISMYDSGIFDECEDMFSDDWTVNHAVTLIGYGKEGKNRYWKVQNSWGESWGEGGRIRILRRFKEEAHCGMDNKPQEGVACEGETDPVKVCGTCGILFDSVIPHFGAVNK